MALRLAVGLPGPLFGPKVPIVDGEVRLERDASGFGGRRGQSAANEVSVPEIPHRTDEVGHGSVGLTAAFGDETKLWRWYAYAR